MLCRMSNVLGILYLANLSAKNSCNSCNDRVVELDWEVEWSLSTTTAVTLSPSTLCGQPITAASLTNLWPNISLSISREES